MIKEIPTIEELTYIQGVDIIGGLSKTSKMPWYSWSTSAFDCKTGSELRKVEGSVCSSCYACRGCYVFPSVRVAHDRKLKALKDPRFVDAFVVVLKSLYRRGQKTYLKKGERVRENRFRWHDSGDLQSLEHLKMLNQIALRVPEIDFWLPTKEAKIVSKFLQSDVVADNLNIRLSYPMIGGSFKRVRDGLTSSTVGVLKAPMNCHAQTSGTGKCGDCRSCWDKDVEVVNYQEH